MQCPNCGGGLTCPKCSTNASEITRLNQLMQQLNAELQRIKAESKRKITGYKIAVSISIPIAVTLTLTASFPGLGKAIIDYLTQIAVTKSNQSDPSSGERNSLYYEDKIQPNGFIIAKEFTIEEPTKEVNINVDVASCQNCTGQAPIIRKLNEDEFQRFQNGDLPLSEDSSGRKGTASYARHIQLTEGRYRVVIYNPSDRLIVVRYGAQVQ
jgi:hypothetical protein